MNVPSVVRSELKLGKMYKSSTGNQQEENMSNLTCAISGEASVSSCNRNEYVPPPLKKKRNQPGHPDPGAEVIALSPRSLLATNRFVCEVCNKGFQRDQNLQLHRRGHNLPWKLKQRSTKEVRKKVYICPEVGCVHHDASRALGDLTGIKKHFYRKHGEKKWKCDKCSKKYAVQSDWKAHSKICGTREYKCDCGTVFSRRDSFITHRAFCDALAQENGRSSSLIIARNNNIPPSSNNSQFNTNISQNLPLFQIKKEQQHNFIPPWLSFGGPTPPPLDPTPNPVPLCMFGAGDYHDQNPNPSSVGPTTSSLLYQPSPYISATALLQKAAEMGSKCSSPTHNGVFIRPHNQAHVTPPTAGFGTSRDDELFVHGQLLPASSYGNKAVAGGGGGGGLIHEMMMIANAGFDSCFDDDMAAFGDILMMSNSKKELQLQLQGDGGEQSFHATVGQFSNVVEAGDINMTTRDFLGLRPPNFSHTTDIFSINSAFDTSNNSCNHNN